MRADLFALTEEAIVRLSNRGLVKRAAHEIEAGAGPTLEESPDGRVLGRFSDGVAATLPPGVSLADGSCTCGSVTVCRHRVAVALAYRGWRTRQGGVDPPSAIDPWWPAAIDDETLAQAVGRRSLARAAALRARGCDITLQPAGPDTPAQAQLPTVSVHLLVPGDLGYARCGCSRGGACEHIALAVWAFRIASRAPDASRLVHLVAPVDDEGADDGVEPALALSRTIVLEGVVNLSATFAATIARARARTAASGAVWLSTLIHDLDDGMRAYRERSARYNAHQLAVWLAEIAARIRAARHADARSAPGERRMVLGIGESPETPLGHTRLVSLGARVFDDGSSRGVELLFAEPSSATVLVTRKQWAVKPDETPRDGGALLGRSLWPGVRVGDAARAQIITRAGVRLADRQLRVSAARRGETSVVEQRTPWSELPPPILVRDLSAHAAGQASRPPTCLRPRVLAEAVHAIDIGCVRDVAYAPGRQLLIARLEDVSGTPFLVVAPYRSAAPYALDSLAETLSDRAARPRQISGELTITSRGFELAPIGVFVNDVIVPDLARSSPASKSAGAGVAALSSIDVPLPADPLGVALLGAWSRIEEAAHRGLLRLPATWSDATRAAAARLRELGLTESAAILDRLAAAVGAGLDDAARRNGAVSAWETAAIRLMALSEALETSVAWQGGPA